MKILKILLQSSVFIALISFVALGTLRIQRSGADGATIVFPGGEMIAGELHMGPEPDWSFTDNISTIELQLNDPINVTLERICLSPEPRHTVEEVGRVE